MPSTKPEERRVDSHDARVSGVKHLQLGTAHKPEIGQTLRGRVIRPHGRNPANITSPQARQIRAHIRYLLIHVETLAGGFAIPSPTANRTRVQRRNEDGWQASIIQTALSDHAESSAPLSAQLRLCLSMEPSNNRNRGRGSSFRTRAGSNRHLFPWQKTGQTEPRTGVYSVFPGIGRLLSRHGVYPVAMPLSNSQGHKIETYSQSH